MTDFKSILRRFWIWITGAVAIAVIAIWQYAVSDFYQNLKAWVDWPHIIQWLDGTAKYLSSPVKVPFFIFLVWCAISASVALYSGWLFWWKPNRIDWNSNNSIRQNFRRMPWNNLDWQWGYHGLSVDVPRPICPKCHAEMFYEEFGHGNIGLRVFCPNDDHQVQFDATFPEFDVLRYGARREILRIIRSKADAMDFH